MRENGYYWVRYCKEDKEEIAEWINGHWEFIGTEGDYHDEELYEIGEKVERKEEDMNYAEKLIDAIHEAVKQGFTVQISVNDSMKFVTGRTELLYKIRHTPSALEYGISIPDQTLYTESAPHLTEYMLFIEAIEKMKAHKVS